jgi:hypothetical protein
VGDEYADEVTLGRSILVPFEKSFKTINLIKIVNF